ncbi:hypothetical protein F5Y19DRAFT_354295 [Xylariaceae sp. FL1651]|nr:hypothetical protein F5Y19DRAFT_354295 [Xylariaceae sp. FL1651]
MPLNDRERREAHRRLMKKYKIEFVGPVDSLSDRDQIPDHHHTIVSHIRHLSRNEFSQFRESIAVDSDERPWREQIRRRAERVASLADSCRKARKNEPGWRLTLESEILARLTVEVACRKCSGRLWRSEQEVTQVSISAEYEPDLLTAQNLKRRQEKRTPCICKSNRYKEDPAEQGINPLFDDRAEEPILYDNELRNQLQQQYQKPDRVYGIRETKRLRRILEMEDRRSGAAGKLIEETLRTTPFRSDGEPILFPFLILEAKSEKAVDSFTDVEMQTAFAIREFLMLQDSLRQAAQEGDCWEAGPLVWFLSNKGEHWRVSIGYINFRSNKPRFLVVRLWEGAIDSKDCALQLLLIVDYICDWARDIYRESIIQSLRSLVINDSRSLAYDTDIFSSAERVNQWQHQDSGDQHDLSETTSRLETDQDHLRILDTPYGAMRDIRYLRSYFLALYITKDNIPALLQSTDSHQESKALAESILKLLKRAWRVERDALDALELGWTGTDRDRSDMYPPDQVFFVVATVSAYISPDWQQTLELGYLAVAEDVLGTLLNHSGYHPEENLPPSSFPFVKSDTFKESFLLMRKHKPTDILIGCASRCCVSTTVQTSNRSNLDDLRHVTSIEKIEKGVTYRIDAAIYPDDKGRVHDFISTLYRRHRIGRQDPSSSFFRISSQFQKQAPLDDASLPWEHLWMVELGLPDIEQQGILLAVSQNRSTPKNAYSAGQITESCIFVTSPTRFIESLRDCINGSLSPWQFQVRRLDHQTFWSRGRNEKNVRMKQLNFPDLSEVYVDTLNTLVTQKIVDVQDTAAQTWGPWEPNRSFNVVAVPEILFNLLGALEFARAVPRQRMASVTWNSPKACVRLNETLIQRRKCHTNST